MLYAGIAKQELMAMLEEEELRDAILLVFANKQDSRGALNSRHVRIDISILFILHSSHHLCSSLDLVEALSLVVLLMLIIIVITSMYRLIFVDSPTY